MVDAPKQDTCLDNGRGMPSEEERFPSGTMIQRYEILRPLGRGGMGEVYLARDTRLGRLVALKFLLHIDEEQAARFIVEAKAMARLTHENIVALYDIAEHQGMCYLVMEYIRGKPLSDVLAEHADGVPGRPARIPPARAAELLLPVARALVAAHEAGIVHRDLKPHNIMLATSGTVKVLDFGLAKLVREAEWPEIDRREAAVALAGDPSLSLTQPGGLLGTLAYMAPEQWTGEGIDERTDIWALGIMLYEMVAGEHPLAPASLDALAAVALFGRPVPSAKERMPELGELGGVIDRCLQKKNAERLGSARELCAELSAIARQGIALRRVLGEEDNPYAGLLSFQERDAGRFFGREKVVEQILARIVEQPLLCVVGASGVGKSSLVRAGVVSALKRRGGAWQAFVTRPGPHPLAEVADLLLHHVHDDQTSSEEASAAPRGDRESLRERLRGEPGLLGVELRAEARRRRGNVLLFIDQFEEAYTLAQEDERGAFFACISGAADDMSSPVRVILSVRHDFLDRIAATAGPLAELVSRGSILVGPMDREGMRSALVKPAEALGYSFESEALVDEMLDALSHTSGALPLLQSTASMLWESRDRERRLLTEGTYRTFGGVAGALASHADSVLAGMSASERTMARALLLRLVTPEGTRAVVGRDELGEVGGATGPEVERVLRRLIDARLLTVGGTAGDESAVELVHESLIEKWPLLASWLEEAQGDVSFLSRLRAAAREWEASNRAEGLLWRGETAEEASRWWKRRDGGAPLDLGVRERTYLAAVISLSERERRRRRQLVTGAMAILGAIVVLVSAFWLRAKREAQRADQEAALARAERDQADESAARARNAVRMAAARERIDNPTAVLALLREMEPGPLPQGWSELARWARDAGVARTVLFHPDQVQGAAFSPDGRRIVTASLDKSVRVWNADGSGEPLVLRGHEEPASAVAWSPDGRHIVSASLDKTARVWNADGTGTPLVLRGHSDMVLAVAWSRDARRIATASWDETVRVWNADGSGEPRVLRGHAGAVTSVAWSPDDRRIASGSVDKTVRVWNAEGDGDPLELSGHEHRITSVAWSPDGRRLVSTSFDGTARVWDMAGKGEPRVLRGAAELSSVGVSPDGRRIVAAAMDKTLRVWDEDRGGEMVILHGHDDVVVSASFGPDGRSIVSASWDKTVRVWDEASLGSTLVLRRHGGPVFAAAYGPDGRRIASANEATVWIWEDAGLGKTRVLRGHEKLVNSVTWSPDGRRVASGATDKTVRVWSADGTGEPLVLRGHADAVTAVSFSPDGRRIASASVDKTVRVWDADGAAEPLVLRGHEAPVSRVAWSPDGRRIVSASTDRTLRLWNADGEGEPIVLRGHEGEVDGAAWSPDGGHVASASLDKTVRIWKADGTGEPRVLGRHDSMAMLHGDRPFSPDGKLLVSSSSDGTVRIWDVDGAAEPIVFRASSAPVGCASFSPDGARVIATSDDRSIIVWNGIEPLREADDPSLWTATRYCMPLDVRQRLLNFPEAHAGSDLARCQRRVREALLGDLTPSQSPGR